MTFHLRGPASSQAGIPAQGLSRSTGTVHLGIPSSLFRVEYSKVLGVDIPTLTNFLGIGMNPV